MNTGCKLISIIGASGFIGSSFYRYSRNKAGSEYKIIGTCNRHKKDDLLALDITREDALEHHLLTYMPDFVVFAAGTKDVKLCDKDPAYAYMLNTRPVEMLVAIIERNKLDTKVLLLSSDYVFDGKKGGYRESDPTNPLTVYGKSKVLAERSLISSGTGYKIIRTSAVMGRGGTFFDWLINELKTKEELRLFNDIYFSPTPINFLNEMLWDIILYYDKIEGKILHVAGEKKLSRFEFGRLVQKYLDSKTRIIPDTTESGQPMFQHDLSLVSSEIINRWRKIGYEEYFKIYFDTEAMNDKDH